MSKEIYKTDSGFIKNVFQFCTELDSLFQDCALLGIGYLYSYFSSGKWEN